MIRLPFRREAEFSDLDKMEALTAAEDGARNAFANFIEDAQGIEGVSLLSRIGTAISGMGPSAPSSIEP
jgi:hypothetical protein